MPFNASSYFGGVATVLATVAIGFGGGVIMTDALVGKGEKAASLSERRMSEATAPSVPLAVASQGPATGAPTSVIVPAQMVPVQTTVTSPSQPATQVQPRQAGDAMARAQETELNNALAAERRKAERRKWAERRKREMKRIEQQHQVAERAREAERGPNVTQSFFAESPSSRRFVGD